MKAHLKPLILILLIFGAVGPSAATEERPPNIVVILADDLGMRDMALYNGWVELPRIETMAEQGMTFTDFHANSSVCSPTRAALLTGRYQQRVGIVDVIVGSREPDSGLSPELPTLAKTFQQNGYATALFGKWHLGFQDEYNPTHHGFDEFIGLLNGAGDFHVEEDWRNGLEPMTLRSYATDRITSDSVDFIKRHQNEPFFLYVSHQTPHNPYQTRADTPENRKKGWRQNRVSDENRPRYKEMLKDLDDSIGAILDQLRACGLAGKTLVFFWSDNGDVGMSPVDRRLRGTKFGQYEGGHRVPAVAWWPGMIPAGTESDALLLGFDLYPTFTEIAGVSEDNPDNLDGISFADHLLDQAPVPSRDIFFGYEPKLGTAMRRGDWKMILKDGKVQLYNLEKDLKETSNVADKYPEVVESMRAAIEQFKATVVPGS
ncbi:sulfatase [Coraliomargarita sinensis]|uniref:Sulfatase n=1 Tax=Coraliomargarita sinensis TaxID=2174842 RepID=A0A317ZEY7_9BACT|nr:sulfatase-like hydrolase/transferase [Coraliomargarita sinensis]PXA03382.1 sulfatase [Coraliomargarita sinensis]